MRSLAIPILAILAYFNVLIMPSVRAEYISDSANFELMRPGFYGNLVRTYRNSDSDYLSLFGDRDLISKTIWIVRHDSQGNFSSSSEFSIPGLVCVPSNFCTSLNGLTEARNSEIVALVRTWDTPITQSGDYLVWFGTDGSYIRSTRIHSPSDQMFAGIFRNENGDILTYTVTKTLPGNKITLQLYRDADGTIVFSRSYSKNIGLSSGLRFGQIGGPNQNSGSDNQNPGGYVDGNNFHLFINAVEEYSQTLRETYPIHMIFSATSGDILKSISYRLPRINYDKADRYELSAVYHNLQTTIIIGREFINKEFQPKSDSRGFFVWQIDQAGTVIWFCIYKIRDPISTLGEDGDFHPVSVQVSGNEFTVASTVRFSMRKGGFDTMISRHILGDPTGVPKWSFLVRKGYDVPRCCDDQLDDLRDSIASTLLINSTGSLIVAGTTTNRRPSEQIRNNKNPPGQDILTGLHPLFSGLDLWELTVDASLNASNNFLIPYSTWAPWILEEPILELTK